MSDLPSGSGGPERQPRLRRRPEWPTADRLRADIDEGRTGDKVPAIDVAAAPLGTDEEAAGTPLTREDVATAHAAEMRIPEGTRPTNADRDVGAPPRATAEPGSRRGGNRLGSPFVWVVLALLVLAVAFLLFR